MAKETKPVKQYIYKAHYDCTFVVKPTTHKGIYDNVGNLVQYVNLKPIKLLFEGGHCIVNEAFAKKHDIDLDTLAKMVDATPGFGEKFFLVSSPDNEATKEALAEIKEAPKKPKLTQGVRHLGNKSRK